MAPGKNRLKTDDVIIHLDNKSVNHRPDMWGHRGVAREVAAMLNLPFKAIDHMLVAHDIEQSRNGKSVQSKDFTITVENPDSCRQICRSLF